MTARQPEKGESFKRAHVLVVALFATGISVIMVGAVVPWVFAGSPWDWRVFRDVNRTTDSGKAILLAAQIQAALTFLLCLVGILLLVVLYTDHRALRSVQEQLRQSRDQLRVSQDGRTAERFGKAAEQLGATDDRGNPRLETRLAGIYALEQIARDSPRDHWPIMEVLTAYVRHHAPVNHNSAHPPGIPLRADIQAILTAIGRRTDAQRASETRPLEFGAVDLRQADLKGVHLERSNLQGADLRDAQIDRGNFQDANLTGARLDRADLRGARLQNCNLDGATISHALLVGAHLEGASLTGADLRNSRLIDAHLQGAQLDDANLEHADFLLGHLAGANLARANLTNANLEGADLRGADLHDVYPFDAHFEGTNLSEAVGLTQAMINLTFMNDATHLPVGSGLDTLPLRRSYRVLARRAPTSPMDSMN